MVWAYCKCGAELDRPSLRVRLGADIAEVCSCGRSGEGVEYADHAMSELMDIIEANGKLTLANSRAIAAMKSKFEVKVSKAANDE